MNAFQKLRKEFSLEMSKYAPRERVSGFMKNCQKVVDAQEKNEITLEEAGQLIFLGHLYDEDLTAYLKTSHDVFVTDEILDIASNMDTLPEYYPEGRDPKMDWQKVKELLTCRH
ncbi:MAG: hypothetical protein AAB787_02275 [Patescibacteria group bacterium]|mgnify:CR=1 FL=1